MIGYLIYKRLRPAIGMPFGFILMFGAYTGAFNMELLLVAFSFFMMELFGGFYNDYWDYEEDMREGRKDKFTTTGILTRKQMWYVSAIIAVLSLFLLLFTNLYVFVIGSYYLSLFVGYSHPRIRLKGHIKGYAILSSMFLVLPFVLPSFLNIEVLLAHGLLFSFFWFTQTMYILTQKDSTDPRDDSNLFLGHGWWKALGITTVFGVLSSACLLVLCILINPFLIAVWVFNLFAKFMNLYKIKAKTITRKSRQMCVLLEFITPFLYIFGGLFG